MKTHNYTYIPSTAQLPNSLDPLDADQLANQAIARMIYATPIEISIHNKLVSQVLSAFDYSESSNVMHWVVETGLRFSDGLLITSDDVAFAVARMLKARPDFPVICEISGKAEWLQRPHPLESYPDGVKVNGNSVIIAFDKPVSNPLYRFTFELFSIVPRTTVNLLTGQLQSCEIPSSGNYEISNRGDDSITFSKFRGTTPAHELDCPEEVRFSFQRPVDWSDLDGVMIEQSDQYAQRISANASKKQGLVQKPTQMKSFVGLILSPLVDVFSSPPRRQIFAEGLRARLALEIGTEGIGPSLFANDRLGYLNRDELYAQITNHEEILDSMRGKLIPWMRRPKFKNNFTDTLIEKTAQDLKLTLSDPTIVNDGAIWAQSLNTGKIAFFPFMSSFSLADPVGDVRMLLTPTLHQPLKLIADDPFVHRLLNNLSFSEDTEQKMKALNRYIYSTSIFNPLIHFPTIYISNSAAALDRIATAVEHPYPWQLFCDHP